MSDLRPATTADGPALEAFLRRHAATSMFQLDHFLRGQGQFWRNDPLTDVLCIAPSGMIQPVFTQSYVAGLSKALTGQTVIGVVGTAQSVAVVKAAVTLPKPALDRIEPGYELSLRNLKMPDIAGLSLVPYALAPRPALIAMRTAYYIEALDAAPRDAPARAIAHVEAGLETNSYRVLMKGNTPLAISGFNTDVGDIVMIGGVYTPPEYRGHGFAGKAIAMHLASVQERGVERAVLSAANVAAGKAYEKIGFEKMATFCITVLENPVTIRD